MTKSRSKSDSEHLKGIINTQKKQINHLKKELGRKAKREHLYTDLEEKEAEIQLREEFEEQKIIKKEMCPDCNKQVESISLGPRKGLFCKCGWRKITKG